MDILFYIICIMPFCMYILLLPVVMYLHVYVHIDGLARICGSSSANTLELSRSRNWPWMFAQVWVRMCVCVFAHLCLCVLFIYACRWTIAHRPNVICCTYTRLWINLVLSYLILSYTRFLFIYHMMITLLCIVKGSDECQWLHGTGFWPGL